MKEKSVAVQAKELLDILPHQVLKDFIQDACKSDIKFRQFFVAKHIQFLLPESKELYTKQLKAFRKTYTDKFGFVDSRNAKRLGNVVCKMAGEAMTCLGKGQFQESMFIALAIIEEMADLLRHNMDDPDGQIENCIEEAFSVLDALAESKLNKMQHDELFDSLVTLSEQNSLKGWDWHLQLMGLCIQLVRTNQEKEKIKSELEKIKPNGKSWDWDYKNAQELMLKLIKKTESREAAAQFIENNLANPQFRIELIKQALKAKDYTKVEHLANEGLAQDEKEAPGQADDWRNYLLIAYKQSGDKKNALRFARYFFINSNGRHHPLAYYYELLKSLVPTDQWDDYLNELIDDIKKGSRLIDYKRISSLYIWEEEWDKLLELLRQNPSFERIADAEQYLAESYSNELAALYRKHILTYMERNMGRDHYLVACRYIKRMIEIGAHSMAIDLIRELKRLYPTRKALLEELGNI